MPKKGRFTMKAEIFTKAINIHQQNLIIKEMFISIRICSCAMLIKVLFITSQLNNTFKSTEGPKCFIFLFQCNNNHYI